MPIHDKRFPGESPEYRTARNALLEAELALRRQIETVAAQRRALPQGGALKEDYVFAEGPRDLAADGPETRTRFSDLFGAHDTLLVYSLMYTGDSNPCPGCTSLLDGFQGNVPAIEERVSLAVVAKAPVAKTRHWARLRGWRNLRLLSSRGTSYNADYFAEDADGDQWPVINVFRRTKDGIRHFWASELLFAPSDPGQHGRQADLIWPLWNALDMTPEGRGDGFPTGSYKESLAKIAAG